MNFSCSELFLCLGSSHLCHFRWPLLREMFSFSSRVCHLCRFGMATSLHNVLSLLLLFYVFFLLCFFACHLCHCGVATSLPEVFLFFGCALGHLLSASWCSSCFGKVFGEDFGENFVEKAGDLKPASSTEQTYEFRRFLGRTLGRIFRESGGSKASIFHRADI